MVVAVAETPSAEWPGPGYAGGMFGSVPASGLVSTEGPLPVAGSPSRSIRSRAIWAAPLSLPTDSRSAGPVPSALRPPRYSTAATAANPPTAMRPTGPPATAATIAPLAIPWLGLGPRIWVGWASNAARAGCRDARDDQARKRLPLCERGAARRAVGRLRRRHGRTPRTGSVRLGFDRFGQRGGSPQGLGCPAYRCRLVIQECIDGGNELGHVRVVRRVRRAFDHEDLR